MHRPKNQIPRGDILDLGDYERQRDEIRPRAIVARSLRRIGLGPNATIAFENRETVTYQIHEMLRAERIATQAEVEHEIATYSDLLPSARELSATLMFEFEIDEGRDVRLRGLVGFERHLFLDFGAAGRAPASFDERQIDDDRISAVQFIRFPLTEAQKEALAKGEASVIADHPSYAFTTALTGETCRALAADLEETLRRETADV